MGNIDKRVTLVDDKGTPQSDSKVNALNIMEYDHHEIHDQNSFLVSDVQSVDTTTLKWMVTTPNTTKYAHMIFDIECTGEMLVTITEGADRTGTNALTAINRYRVGTPTAATVTVHRAYSGGSTDGATTLESKRSGATGVASKTISPGGHRGLNEFVLKPNTKYIISVTTYAAVYVSLMLSWYEHTNKA